MADTYCIWRITST